MTRQCWLLYFLFGLHFYADAQSSIWSNLPPGKYSVGFKTIRLVDNNQNPLLISLWYPAEKGNHPLSLQDLITAAGISAEVPGAALMTDFKNVLKRIYDIDSLQEPLFSTTLSNLTNTYHNSKRRTGRFPLIIGASEPAPYFTSFEYFASNGFVVAAVHMQFNTPAPNPGDPMRRYTDVLGELLNYMYDQPYIQPSDITAFGHGGGIQSAMFLSMRTPKIKRVINLDGGFFGPRSGTTAASDYHPDKFKVPLLHIITVQQQLQDDQVQFKAITSPVTRVSIQSDSIQHHDFTVWGKVLGLGLKKRYPMQLINEVFKETHKIMLKFLSGKEVKNGSSALMKIEKFNW